MQKKIILKSLTTLFLLIFVLFTVIFALEDTAEQYAQSLDIEKSAIKIISRLDKDNQFGEIEKDFITWLASQNKESQFKLAFTYAFDGEISSKEISEILSAPITKKTESEKTSSLKPGIEYLMLDDFEDKKITEENRWNLGNNIHHTTGAEGNAFIDHKVGIETNGSSLCIEYNIPEFNVLSGGHGGEVGSNFRMENYKNEINKYDGITFFMKTTDERKQFALVVDEEKNGVHELLEKDYLPETSVNEWKEVVIPFDDLLLYSEHAIDHILELNEVVGIGFLVTDLYEGSDRKGKVWIDRIALYKEHKKDILVSSNQTDTQKEVIFNFEDGIRNEYEKWNLGINENISGTGSKQQVYIDNNTGADGTNSSLCTEIIGLPSGGKEAEVETYTKLEVQDLDLSQYTGIGFFAKTTCLKKPITLIFIERHNNTEEEWSIRYNPTIEWEEVKIPFNSLEFSPVRDTIDQKLDLSKVREIFVAQYGPLSEIKEKFKIWIDEVSLYKGEIEQFSIISQKDKQIAVYRGEGSQDLSFSIEDLPKSKDLTPHEALHYQKLSGNTVQCAICPNRCTLAEGEVGDCNNRKNIDGKLYTLVYGQPCALTVDPIEKGPMFHMKPGMRTLALGTAGCNLKCKNCQNWQFTQVGPEETENYRLSPQEAINLAHKNNCEAIVFTYNDPIVSYEYVLEMAKLAKKNNLKTIMITAGYINPEPLRELCQYMDAIKIDLKGFTNEFYQQVCRATLQPVLDSIKIIKEEGVWLEIVNLVIPSFNDNSSEIKSMCSWIVDNVGPNVPLHFSRFWHSYKLENMETTPVNTLESAFSIATKAGLNYVYIGNVPGHPKGNTYCPHCGKLLIERIGFLAIGQNNIVNGKCKFCGEKIAGVW